MQRINPENFNSHEEFKEYINNLPPGSAVTIGTTKAFENLDYWHDFYRANLVLVRCCHTWETLLIEGSPGKCGRCKKTPKIIR